METKPMKWHLIGVLVIAQAACGTPVHTPARVSQDRDQFVQEFIWALWVGDPSQTLYLSPRVLQMAGLEDSLAVVRGHLPTGQPRSVELIGAGPEAQGAWHRQFISYQVHGGGYWAGVEALVIERNGEMYIDLLQATPFPASLQEINALTLRDKTPVHFVFILMAAGSFGFCVAVAGFVVRTPMPKRWLWAFVALIGVGQVALHWTSGDVLARPFNVVLLSAGLIRQGYAGPWIVSVAFPVGAFLALERRRRALKTVRRGD